MTETKGKLYIALISIHGLIRGQDLELGRDSDTGGQTKYVVELARALAKHPKVERVDLITRRVQDPQVSEDYAQAEEQLEGDQCRIIRIDAGPEEYLPKEKLWPFMDTFTDNTLAWFSEQGRLPDVVHSHYADAGFVATRISQLMEIPLIHTGHSLGRDKRRRLLATGLTLNEINESFAMPQRIESEEATLASADRVITSTQQEITDQYEMYDFYKPDSMCVIPPGTDLGRFRPPQLGDGYSDISRQIKRFLSEPDKPMILALSRPDPRKNIHTLMEAYGSSPELQEMANLVIIAGNRDDFRKMDEGAESVFTDIFTMIDVYDLYGKVAVPKHHHSEDVPEIYRMAAISRGVFVNPALTEPFGLTLLESAACGLPFVATEIGGPQDIVKNCQCGELVNPLDAEDMAERIEGLLRDDKKWREYSDNGIRFVRDKYSWNAHANRYIEEVNDLVSSERKPVFAPTHVNQSHSPNQLLLIDLNIFESASDSEISIFNDKVRASKKECVFGVVSNKRFDKVVKLINRIKLATPDLLISSRGTEIHYSPNYNRSQAWDKHIDFQWNARAVKNVLSQVEFISLQEDKAQSRFKISYDISSEIPEREKESHECVAQISSLLRQNELTANVCLTDNHQVDVTPSRSSSGMAMRYIAQLWGLALEDVLVVVKQSGYEDLIFGSARGAILKNGKNYAYSRESLGDEMIELNVYFSEDVNVAGIVDASKHYEFLNQFYDPLHHDKGADERVSMTPIKANDSKTVKEVKL